MFLDEIAGQVRKNELHQAMTVRELLHGFGARRRGPWIVQSIREKLHALKLKTDPDFESAYIDAQVTFLLDEPANSHEAANQQITDTKLSAHVTGSSSITADLSTEQIYNDPSYSISKLAAANNKPKTVRPDTTINEAIMAMIQYDFSQIPVMVNDREVKGVVTWNSIATKFALASTHGVACKDFMDPSVEIRADMSFFLAIPIIEQNQFVLVRAKDNSISGIITATDLSLQFRQLTEPFLLLGEIENHIRRMLDGKFSLEILTKAKDQGDTGRLVKNISDLTFGEYIRLMENPERWQALSLPMDRAAFCSQIERVRTIRNDVMHFDPDGIDPEDLAHLRSFTKLLQKIYSIRM